MIAIKRNEKENAGERREREKEWEREISMNENC